MTKRNYTTIANDSTRRGSKGSILEFHGQISYDAIEDWLSYFDTRLITEGGFISKAIPLQKHECNFLDFFLQERTGEGLQ